MKEEYPFDVIESPLAIPTMKSTMKILDEELKKVRRIKRELIPFLKNHAPGISRGALTS